MGDRIFNLLLAFFLSVCLSMSLSKAMALDGHLAAQTEYNWNLPEWTPKPVVPDSNPMTAKKVALGRHLFYEPRLSITGKYSCASCHQQSLAFTDGKQVALGSTNESHTRNSMGLGNVAYSPVLTWANPLITSLENQALIPIFGEHPIEMGMVGKEQQMIQWLQDDLNYQQMFAQAFDDRQPVNLDNLTKAIASFQRSLVSFNSPYDRYRYQGETNAISAAAKRGEKLFNSERTECFHCHTGINFSDSTQHENLAFTQTAFHNTGLYNIDAKGSYPPENIGIKEITQAEKDMGRFKTPSLRNIALTAPYMHDGSIATLREAIAHYQAGGRTISEGEWAGIGSASPYKSGFVKGFEITSSEIDDLIAFLQSLTDREFITNPAYSDPNLPKLK
ncbi:di-heme enzyme [Pleurocapsa sp. CCALA 161]|uniref:methanobactin export MATE transporter MbnM n=1 Tax=Pleurocapsa sp. CCALA 161 TaxID=2107688 RepID=UPI000D050452|nr:methanobactin export MATE transporter MbnM [Pleurocapsa sp. CCALA 161]PSB06929.1 di-heme enzyme [Pleurocapsa sp. CCALA 161]